MRSIPSTKLVEQKRKPQGESPAAAMGLSMAGSEIEPEKVIIKKRVLQPSAEIRCFLRGGKLQLRSFVEKVTKVTSKET